MSWRHLTTRQVRQVRLLTRNLRTQPINDHVPGAERDIPYRPAGLGLATPREVSSQNIFLSYDASDLMWGI